MYAAITPALRSQTPTCRLAARAPARLIRGRRYPEPHCTYTRVQLFHHTPYRAQNPNPEPGADSTPPVNSKDAEKDTTQAKSDEIAAIDEDAEALAQKLQRSREQTRRYAASLRRTQRRNRLQDMPPLRVPGWYIEQRVRLRDDAAAQMSLGKRHEYALTLKHGASGEHASLSIPVSSYAAAFNALSQLMKSLWRREMDDEQKKLLAQDFARRVGREDDVEFVQALEKGEEPRFGLWEELEDVTSKAKKHANDAESAEVRAARMRDHLLQNGTRMSPLQRAEIRAAMAASLSTLRPDINHSFPSTRTNIILHSPSNANEAVLNSAVHSLASELGADVVTLKAEDLAQLGGDYLGEGPYPSPNSIRSLSYDTYKLGPDLAEEVVFLDKESFEEEQESHHAPQPQNFRGFPPWLEAALKRTAKKMQASRSPFAIATVEAGPAMSQPARAQTQGESGLDDMKLATLLEALVDSTELKRSRSATVDGEQQPDSSPATSESEIHQSGKEPKLFDYSFKSDGEELDFTSALPIDPTAGVTFTVTHRSSTGHPSLPAKPKIIHVCDIKELNATRYGNKIVQKLEEIVRNRRSAGESIMIVGTTCSEDLTPEMSPAGVEGLQSEGPESFFRTIVVTPGNLQEAPRFDLRSAAIASTMDGNLSRAEKNKIRNINLRHIQDMVRSLDPASAVDITSSESAQRIRKFNSTFPDGCFWSVMSYDEVHRIALTALGLRQLDPSATQVSWAHITLAMGLLKASDEVKFAYMKSKGADQDRPLREQFREHMDRLRLASETDIPFGRPRDPLKKDKDAAATKRAQALRKIRETASPHEQKLMPGIVDPDEIKTTFDSIHVPTETVEAIRTLTSLSLLRPDAFNYGVLATEKISGALLYGPPGTGKTLLAKAVAKESGCSVLEVSGSQIMDKYVGEGEKNVAAIFSLARKLSPCIVFLDEADAIFGTRDRSEKSPSHRDILNQFLKEWDGLNNLSVFVMVATNRPFDMDDAVIRRLPRRLLVDLPLKEDRKKILEIHLKGEQLDASVDLEDLAARTPLYSGSDLKNVAVFAALACVREENEHAALEAAKKASVEKSLVDNTETVPLPVDGESGALAEKVEPESLDAPFAAADTLSSTSTASPTTASAVPSASPPAPSQSTTPAPILSLTLGQTYTFPARRTLHKRHFDKALQEVSASISENMSSLTAIKKFDEQFGDRQGRKKKTKYGFGVGDIGAETLEREARVRP